MDSGSFATTSIWMERTQWQAIYKGARRDILRALTRLPDRRALAIDCFLGQGTQESDLDIVSSSEAEQKISCILGALGIVVDRCEDTINRTSRFLLCWVNSTRDQHFHERLQSGSREEYRKKVPKCPEMAVGLCLSNAYDDSQSQKRLCGISVERISVLPAPSHMEA
jgi:hypothetical protein